MGFIDAIVTGAIYFAGGLSQQETNGNSLLGTLDAPTLPHFLRDNPLVNGCPWGDLDIYTDPSSPPNTGITRSYTFNITRGKASPDGYQKNMLLINNAFPGPLIEANWGDWISVTVNNHITGPEEGTAFHWHGLLQKETPYFDGVPSVSQCPIAPSSTFTYRFRADRYGSSFYHSHYSAQYAGGLVGPLVIYGPKSVEYDIDLGPVMISDLFHEEYFKIIQGVTSTNLTLEAPHSDNNMINGKMNYNCSLVTDGTPCVCNAGLSKFKFTSGKTHLLRVINNGAAGFQQFSIDGHNMTVIANDFVPVKPYNTTMLTMGIGQRTDVLVMANGNVEGAYWMRANLSTICALPNQPYALAAIYYEKANTSRVPDSIPQFYDTRPKCNNDDLSLTVPIYPKPVKNPTATLYLEIIWHINATGHQEWLMNNQTFRGDYNQPILLLAKEKNYSYPYDPQWNVYDFGSNKTIRIIVQNQALNSNVSRAHPMHIHGHDFQVLHDGDGMWDGTITNPSNPQRRDTQMLRPGGHFVIQFEADNPGIWPFHCHIAWHVSTGLYINIMERPKDIRNREIPMVMQQTCRDWQAYTQRAVVDQIDSGL